MRRTVRLSRTRTVASMSGSSSTATTTTSSVGGGFVVASSIVTAHPDGDESTSTDAAHRSPSDRAPVDVGSTAATSSTTTSASAVGMWLSTKLFGTEVMLPDTEQYSSVSPSAEIDMGSFRVYETALVSDLIWQPSLSDRVVRDRVAEVTREVDGYGSSGSGATSGDMWVHELAHSVCINALTQAYLAAEQVSCRVETELLCSHAVVELPMGLCNRGPSCCVCRCNLAEVSTVSLRLLAVQPCGHLLCQQCYGKVFRMTETDDRPPLLYGQLAMFSAGGLSSAPIASNLP